MTADADLTRPDALGLLAAIDAGDTDVAFLALADLLEEQDDPRAAGLRLALLEGLRPAEGGHPDGPGPGHWYWEDGEREIGRFDRVGEATFDRLPGYEGSMFGRSWPENRLMVFYPTRSVAYLARALAWCAYLEEGEEESFALA